MKTTYILFILLNLFHTNSFAQFESPNRLELTHTKAEKAMSEGNFAIAYCLWSPLANDGDKRSQFNIGWMYHNGYGLTINDDQALSWWLKAAEQGYLDALFALADLYLAGFGVEKDNDIAMGWYIAAAERGHEAALEIIHALSFRTDKRSKKYHQKLIFDDWHLKLALKGNIESKKILRSLAVKPDKKSKKYFSYLVKNHWSILGKVIQIKVERANVRGGPGTQYKIISSLKQGDQLLAISKQGNWSQVAIIESGEIVWVFSKLTGDIGSEITP